MPTISPQVTPYYGGGQVQNPSNVIRVSGSPSTVLTEDGIGTLAVDNAAANIYGLASKSGGVNTWVLLGGTSGAITAVNGTANQITATTVANTVTLSLPAAITAPGSLTTTTSLSATTTVTAGTGITSTTGNITASAGNIVATLGNISATAGSVSAGTTVTGGTGITATTGDITASAGAVNAGTSITATLGAITATNGNLVLGTAGNKLSITTGANASVGVSDVMAGTPGVVTVTTTACTTSSVILYSRATTGGTPGEVSITSQLNGSFELTSTANETSTFNYLIIN